MASPLRNPLSFLTLAVCLLTSTPVALHAQAVIEAPSKLVNKAYELFESGKTEQALVHFNQALEEDQKDLTAHLGRAMVYSEQLRFQDAFEAYDYIVENYPTHAFAWNGRGLAALNLQNFDVALRSFERATADQPINGFFYESLAWAHFCRRDYPEAAASAKQAILMYNQNGETASYPLLITYFSQLEEGNRQGASRTLKYAQNNRPVDGSWPAPVFDYLLGTIVANDLVSYVTDSAEETEAHTYIGLHLRSQGQADQAQAHLNWAASKGDGRVFEHTLARSLQMSEKVALLAP